MRFRRKFVRFSGGSASQRRIMSRRANSLSSLRALSRSALVILFFFLGKCGLEDVHYGQILWTARSFLTFDDISQASHQESRIAKTDLNRAPVESLYRSHAIYSAHEVKLQLIHIALDSEKIACRIKRAHEDRVKIACNGLQLTDICGSLAK